MPPLPRAGALLDFIQQHATIAQDAIVLFYAPGVIPVMQHRFRMVR
jgi:hypothetical protein